MTLYETPYVPRATVLTQAVEVPDAQDHAAPILFEPYDEFTLVHVVGDETPPSGEPGAGEPAGAEIVEDRADRVVVTAKVPDGGGYLRLLDTFNSDWEATVDGRPAAVVRADALFRAVRLQSGTHRVEFDYRPRAFRLGLAVTVVTALVLAAAAWFGRRPKRTASLTAA
jgi:hypothetical protein